MSQYKQAPVTSGQSKSIFAPHTEQKLRCQLYDQIGTRYLEVRGNTVIKGNLEVQGTFNLAMLQLPMGMNLVLNSGIEINGDACVAAGFTVQSDALASKSGGAISVTNDVVVTASNVLQTNAINATSGGAIAVGDMLQVDKLVQGVGANGVCIEDVRLLDNNVGAALLADTLRLGVLGGNGDVTISRSGAITLIDGALNVNEGGTWMTGGVNDLNLGTDAQEDPINIGTGSTGAGRVVTIGSTMQNGRVTLQADSANAQEILLNGDTRVTETLTVLAGAVINSNGQSLDLGTDANNDPINIGTASGVGRTITIGDGNVSTEVILQAQDITLDGNVEIDTLAPVAPSTDISVTGNLIMDPGTNLEVGEICGVLSGTTPVRINDLTINQKGGGAVEVNNDNTVSKPMYFGTNSLSVTEVYIGHSTANVSLFGQAVANAGLRVPAGQLLETNELSAVTPITSIDVQSDLCVASGSVVQSDEVQAKTTGALSHGIFLNGGLRKIVREVTTSDLVSKEDHIIIWNNNSGFLRQLTLPSIDLGGADEGLEIVIRVRDATPDTLQVSAGNGLIVKEAGGTFTNARLITDETWRLVVIGVDWVVIDHTTIAARVAP